MGEMIRIPADPGKQEYRSLICTLALAYATPGCAARSAPPKACEKDRKYVFLICSLSFATFLYIFATLGPWRLPHASRKHENNPRSTQNEPQRRPNGSQGLPWAPQVDSKTSPGHPKCTAKSTPRTVLEPTSLQNHQMSAKSDPKLSFVIDF